MGRLCAMVMLVGMGGCAPERPDPIPATSDPMEQPAGLQTAVDPSAPALPPQPNDQDDDGLNDAEELDLGTDPWEADTDGDGLTDFQEVRETHTDPLNPDTDGDWVNDGIEVEDGTDPFNAEPTTLVVGTLEVDRIVEVVFTGAPPNSAIDLRYGLVPSLTCPPDEHGVCWVMDDPHLWADGTTDDRGDATVGTHVPNLPDGVPVLVQASLQAPDGEYLASRVVEALISHPVRTCGNAVELGPIVQAIDIGDAYLVCTDPSPCPSFMDLTTSDVRDLFEAAWDSTLPAELVAEASCDELSVAEACCYAMTVTADIDP